MRPLRHIRDAQVILASASPRRADLLRQIGISFAVEAGANVDETMTPGEDPRSGAQRVACSKARAGCSRHPKADLVIAADTIVVLDDAVLGKPADAEEASLMLSRLAGRRHQVVTGFAVMGQGKMVSGTETTEVQFKPLDAEAIAAYVSSGESLDKAGAYGIQGIGALLVVGIAGDYTNVVGLPLPSIGRALESLGWSVL